MTIAAGTHMGPYEIVSALGAGGMGEVYRATDKNLGRQVAIKVLPEAFASDADRLARFDREKDPRRRLHDIADAEIARHDFDLGAELECTAASPSGRLSVL
jgi:serine/threonine protein kinase